MHTWRLGRIRLPSLRLRVSERRLLLLLMDLVIINGALATALPLRQELINPAHSYITIPWFFVLSVEWMLVALFFNCYDLVRSANTTCSLRGSISAVVTTVVIYSLTPVITPSLGSRGFLLLFLLTAAGAMGAWRFTYARLCVHPWCTQQALIVGAGWVGQTAVIEILSELPESDANPFRGSGYRVLGFVDDGINAAPRSVAGIPALGTGPDLVALTERLAVDEIVIAITEGHDIQTELFDALLRCRERGLRITMLSVLSERLTGRVPIDQIGRDLSVVIPMGDSPHERAYRLIKRGSDICFALLGFGLMVLLLPFVALGNALTSPGPLFYQQERVGRGGRTFRMLKFRSMVPDAESETGAVWASSNDDRITHVGRILRKTHLDESPQAINILRGDMSLIGPRPERPEFVNQLVRECPFYRARHAVRPGLTGWAQVQYDYGNSIEHAKAKLEYDLYYVKHAGFLLDLRILLTTLPVMLSMRGL